MHMPTGAGRAALYRARAYRWRIHRMVGLYGLCVLGLLLLMTWAENQGLARHWIGPIFLFVPVMMYAVIGVWGRTGDADEYYVAGRRIPRSTTAWRQRQTG